MHRDLKPENILFKSNMAKLCDFGIATQCSNGQRLST